MAKGLTKENAEELAHNATLGSVKWAYTAEQQPEPVVNTEGENLGEVK